MTVIAVLLTIITIGMWTEAPTMMPTANAAIPDTGGQLIALTGEMEKMNNKLESIESTLISGSVKVQIVSKNDLKGKSSKRISIKSK